ncbi:DNA-binding transcriptional regulator, MocR family, contains an aminotransferase domain [Paenibacillus sp. UNC496MF]|uniref:aminotransferase-like domain-containing protein n=1 Tax=Paenibacillus sp. UNC496MF TaxID=1502753 RepID=UPI0008E88AAE|nr:PLP-dependent aminotransferase family protein [Paenibacillus sp. UNC496MF]SFI41297.1 DNA-binding transcriptional regulator, MocR family, contains an aminotransferase domain [Paenibacillus sp. UNC496MF]
MLYEAIVNRYLQEMKNGTRRPGDKLPSIREAAETFGCSRNTVIRAYEELANRHRIYSVPQSGYYVAHRSPACEGAGDAAENQDVIDFAWAGPDRRAMPFRDFQHCMNEAIERYRENMFTYSEEQGLASLRLQLARHLRDLQVFTVPERVCVVTGSQQALHLLVWLPFPNGKRNIVVEQPVHAGMIESLRGYGGEVHGIPYGEGGMDLDRLEALFRDGDVKCFYTVSRFHNPTGHSHTNEARKRMAELAQRYDVYIIEDDYMGDLDGDSRNDPMFAYDASGRVIYVKSFSKVMLPGLRLGLAVLPDELREPFLRAKAAADVHSPLLTQGALEVYLESGMFAAHIGRMRDIYRRKAVLLREAYRKHLPPGTAYTGSSSGFYSTIKLPAPLRAQAAADRLLRLGVRVDPAERMYLPAFRQEDVFRLSVSQVDETLIEPGVLRIGEGIRELLRQRTEVRFVERG